jgi:hypothetical protein
MSEDLVDRISRARKETDESESRRQALALLRSSAVEQNSDFAWLEIIKTTKALIGKYNKTFPGTAPVAMSVKPGSPPQGFDVNCPLFPIATLAVWKNSPHFFEFSAMRASASFGPEENDSGRIDIVADDNRNISFITRDGPKPTAQDVAEFLLEALLNMRP